MALQMPRQIADFAKFCALQQIGRESHKVSETPSSLIEFPEDEPPTVVASFSSRCGLCDEPVHEGDDITLCEGEWCHADCVLEEVTGFER